MHSSVIFSELPGFSKLFIDFIAKKPFFNHCFSFNSKLFNSQDELIKRASEFNNRKNASKAITTSMDKLSLTIHQKENLNSLEKEDLLAVVTGQQAGFLGGPIYTLLKAQSAISLSDKLNSQYENIKFIPVFWVEDNDHDNLEASQAVLYDKEYKIQHLFCTSGASKENPTSVSELQFNSEIEKIIDEIYTCLPENEYSNSIKRKLKEIYKPGKSWSNAFIELMNSWFGQSGLLFIKASDVRKLGFFQKPALNELQNLGKTQELVNNTNQLLTNNGYHLQAKVSDVNLFFHKEDKRLKIIKEEEERFRIGAQTFSHSEMLALANSQPDAFSPNVILRPLFQDSILPTAAYVAGPSEIGYSTQIHDLYNYFDIPMPAFIPRHSASFLDASTSRFLEMNRYKPDYFLTNFPEIEKKLNDELFDREIDALISKGKEKINDIYGGIQVKSEKIDPTLKGAGSAAQHKSIEQLELLEKKIHTAQKRIFAIIYDKYRSISNFLYPEGTLQERIYSPINFMAAVGEENFLEKIKNLCSEEPDKHYFINLLKENMD